LRLRTRLGEPALDEEQVEPLLRHGRQRRSYEVRTARPETISARTDVSAVSPESLVRPVGGLVDSSRAPVGSALEHVAVAVEDVVDDLEEQTELGAERAPRCLLPFWYADRVKLRARRRPRTGSRS
jgi:hypothetical protein